MPPGDNSVFSDDMCREARELCEAGYTDDDLAEHFGVTRKTIQCWAKVSPAFAEARRSGKQVPDDRVERTGYSLCIGFTGPDGKFYPPSENMIKWWLRNRRGDVWKDKQEHEITGKDGTPLVPILNVTIASKKDDGEKQ